MNVCVFASSSSRIHNDYAIAASTLGKLLALSDMGVVFGGGGIGLMGKLADAVMANGGMITGVIPSFMKDEGWDHKDLTDMIVTSDMGERKKRMFELSDAIVALPGGIGTLEELTEAITLKQLGLYSGPIIILNTKGFYVSLIKFLEDMISENFLRFEHKDIWSIAETPEDVISYLIKKNEWIQNPRSIAKI